MRPNGIVGGGGGGGGGLHVGVHSVGAQVVRVDEPAFLQDQEGLDADLQNTAIVSGEGSQILGGAFKLDFTGAYSCASS